LTARRKNWNDYVVSAETVARGEPFCRLRDEIFARAEISPGDRVVDLGAGTGLLSLPAADEAGRVWAVDISCGMCDYLATKARSAELSNIETVVASVTSLPLVDDSVDVAISNYCFHHLSDVEKRTALAEVHRVLAPGGRIVFADMMFSLSPADRRNRAVVRSKIRALLAKGPAGAWRLVRNAGRWLFRRWERPAPPEWWAAALHEIGFVDVRVQPLHHEGGIACAQKRPSGLGAHSRRDATPALAAANG
jgi:ubiquinone/menaquinone biosynthesis C-methylase UbiE